LDPESPNDYSRTQGKKKLPGVYRDFAPFLTLGFQLAAAVIIFFLIGHWVDKKLGIEPVGKLIGVLIGSIGGFVKFFKSVASLTADKEKRLYNKKIHED
jgi:F0F1-type ATP synthase assembly protein I